MNNNVVEQMHKMGIDYTSLDEIRNKEGISVYRVKHKDCSYILKCFANNDDTREIENYKMLSKLNIPTIKAINYTDNAILIEDINCSDEWRLGTKQDLTDPMTAKLIARWYKQLHSKGKVHATNQGSNLYNETNMITVENLYFIQKKSGTQNNPVWQKIKDNLHIITNIIQNLENTLTYNDFYWTNLAVAKDKSQALMFDYNLLGKGYAFGDVRNVCSSLSVEAREAFIKEYGEINCYETVVDDAISPLICLYGAYKREVFPEWAKGALEKLKNGQMFDAVERLLNKKQKP